MSTKKELTDKYFHYVNNINKYDHHIVLRIINDNNYSFSMYGEIKPKLRKVLEKLEKLGHITKDYQITPKGKQLVELTQKLIE